MGGVFIGKCLVDAALVDAIQDGLQAAHIVDVAFQTVLDALYKIAFLEHYRVGAAMLFPGGARLILCIMYLHFDSQVRLTGEPNEGGARHRGKISNSRSFRVPKRKTKAPV